jgi:prepilin-type processing-associated H-X9-DG protein
VSRIASAASDRKTCFDNLRQIGQAMQMYANENRGSFPRTVYQVGNGSPTPVAYTAPTARDPFGPGGPAPNDVTAALFLLLRTQDISSKYFVCPAAPVGEPWNFGGKTPADVSNFPGRQFLSYSYANPYPSKAAVDAGFRFNGTLPPDFALAADMNSGMQSLATVRPNAGATQMRQVNTRSHDGEGQNVLYADGHVEFQNTVFCGMHRTPAGGPPERDNIYTANIHVGSPSSIIAAPADPQDSVLLPCFPDGPIPATSAVRRTTAVPVQALPRSPAGASVHVHDANTPHWAPWWVWVLAFGLSFLLLGGMAVVAILLSRRALQPSASPHRPGPIPPPLPPRTSQGT